jgi:hypothetical protein
MTAVARLAIDRVDSIEPRVQERPERRKRDGKPFPDVDGGEKEKREREPDAPASRSPRPDDGEDEHLVDVLVRGRGLPTGQLLPGGPAATWAS